jgi:hypothetical protein
MANQLFKLLEQIDSVKEKLTDKEYMDLCATAESIHKLTIPANNNSNSSNEYIISPTLLYWLDLAGFNKMSSISNIQFSSEIGTILFILNKCKMGLYQSGYTIVAHDLETYIDNIVLSIDYKLDDRSIYYLETLPKIKDILYIKSGGIYNSQLAENDVDLNIKLKTLVETRPLPQNITCYKQKDTDNYCVIQ